MADLALGVVKDIVKTGMAIRTAVETVHQNEEECQDLLVLVDTLIAILSRLEKMGLTSHPAMSTTALVVLHGSLVRALNLVTKCQKRNAVHRFLTAGEMAKKLHRVLDDIQRKIQLGNLAITATMMEITVELTRTTIVRCDGAHPPLPTQPQGAVEMEIYSSHLSSGDARSEEVTMVTERTEAPFAPSSSNVISSGLTEFSLAESGIMSHVGQKMSTGGSGYTVRTIREKIVIALKVQSNAIAFYAAWRSGVDSVELAGDAKDQVVVVGDGVDSIELTCTLHEKVGHAELVEVADATAKEEEEMPAAAAGGVVGNPCAIL